MGMEMPIMSEIRAQAEMKMYIPMIYDDISAEVTVIACDWDDVGISMRLRVFDLNGALRPSVNLFIFPVVQNNTTNIVFAATQR